MRSSEDKNDLVYRSDSPLVKILGLGDTERFFLVCNCRATSEDRVVLMVLSVFLSSPPLFPSHSLMAFMAEMRMKMQCAKCGHLGIRKGSALHACRLSLLHIALALTLVVPAHILN